MSIAGVLMWILTLSVPVIHDGCNAVFGEIPGWAIAIWFPFSFGLGYLLPPFGFFVGFFSKRTGCIFGGLGCALAMFTWFLVNVDRNGPNGGLFLAPVILFTLSSVLIFLGNLIEIPWSPTEVRDRSEIGHIGRHLPGNELSRSPEANPETHITSFDPRQIQK